MNREGLSALVLLLSVALFTPITYAETAESVESLTSIDSKLQSKNDEVKELDATIAKNEQDLQKVTSELTNLKNKTKELDEERLAAQSDLEMQYNRMINDPELDIAPFQKRYQDSWQQLKENQIAELSLQQDVQEQTRLLRTNQRKKQHIQDELEVLEEYRQETRVVRLQEELTAENTIEVTHTTTCQTNITLAKCAAQGKSLSMQKAVSSFQQQLIDGVTEADIVRQNVKNTSLNIHVLNNEIMESGFNGTNHYTTKLQTSLRANPKPAVSCQLLGLEVRYCIKKQNTGSDIQKKKEQKWIELTIRSNQYNDKVTVDDISYGSTPIDIMLPSGAHEIIVEKKGFKPYYRAISLQQNSTIWANLEARKKHVYPSATSSSSSPVSTKKEFNDSLNNGQLAPKMVIIDKGQYYIGDKADKVTTINQNYSISKTPVTFSQFSAFVNSSNYVTDSEKGVGCSALVDFEVQNINDQNWKNPGFEQEKTAPVVCVSKHDAEAYTDWLTKKTGFTYQLPSESQWEVAARANSKTAFWWGDEIGAGNANTGWSGTNWSNKSTSPVASFAANPYGLYDTVGNVWEWTNNQQGVVRGGAWNFTPSRAKVYEKLELNPETSANYTGFRVVRLL